MINTHQFDGKLARLLSLSATEVLEALTDGVVIADREGNILTMNAAALRMYGYTDVAEARQPLAQFRSHYSMYRTDGSFISTDQWPLSRVLQGETVSSSEAEVRQDDSSNFFVGSYSGSLVLSADGVPEAAVLTIRDITEAKLCERDLRRAEEERLLAFEAANIGAWRRNFQTGDVYFSPRCREQFGFTPDMVLNREVIYRAIHEADRDSTAQALEEAIRTHSDYEAEYRVHHPDGAERWLSVKGRATYDVSGEPFLVQGVCLDVTERRRAAEELLAVQRQFHHAQKLDSLGVLAGGVAHDFNNLLTGILGNSSLVLDSLTPGDSNRPLLEEVVKAGERAADLTRQLLAYAGKGRFLNRRIDLSEVVREIDKLIRTSIPRSVHVAHHLPPGLPAIEGDPSQIQQIAMNLILNAAEAIGTDQLGTVLVETCVTEVNPEQMTDFFNAEALTKGNYVQLLVHDTGSGMDEATKLRIFDPFFTTKFTGRGLGLSAVLGIVRGHRGALHVNSVPGTGTSFTVVFPIAGNQPETAKHTAASGSEVILAIGKCHDRLRNLQELGYPVLFCDDLRMASSILRQGREPVAVVICSGGEENYPAAVHRYRPGVHVILSSDLPPVEQIRKHPGHRFSAFVCSSQSVIELDQAIRQVLTQQ